MIIKHHANGKEDDPLANWEFGEIVATMQQEQATNKSRYVDFLKSKGNKKRLWVTIFLGMGSNWVGNGILGCKFAVTRHKVGRADVRLPRTRAQQRRDPRSVDHHGP